MKKLISLGILSSLALSLLVGCSAQGAKPDQVDTINQKPVISFEGTVTAVEDGVVTLEDGTVVQVTQSTVFGGDPDSGGDISQDIQTGNFIQGYSADDGADSPMTAQNIWTNLPGNGGGKLRINFEGRVTAQEDGLITLDSGKTVRVGEETVVENFDGTPAQIAVDDYIQGCAADPDATELEALRVLVTIL